MRALACRLYKHQHVAALVLQRLFLTVARQQPGSNAWTLFADMLTDSVTFGEGQYLIALLAFVQRSIPAGTLGLADLEHLLRSLYPAASGESLRELLHAFQARDQVCALTQGALLNDCENSPHIAGFHSVCLQSMPHVRHRASTTAVAPCRLQARAGCSTF